MANASNKIVTRFAPSPTGDPHIGSLRNALYSWIFARQNGGDFLLRIEDTDQSRYKEGSIDVILDTLTWVGLDYDGDVIMQTDRKETHQKYAHQLIESGHAYRCFCTPERLDSMRKDQQARKEPPRYDKTCRNLSEEEIAQKLSESVAHTIRLKIPEDGETKAFDTVRKEIVVKNSELDDFVILKSDGLPTYHLAHIIDDRETNVTHVVRSEEWIPSFPKHIIIHEALGWELPVYTHLPLILAPDKSKLSKRHGATGINEFKSLGFLPDALLNFVLLLGWHPKDGSEQEVFTRDEMLKQFSLDDVQKSGAIFDYQKLDWMNAEYIKHADTKEITRLAAPFLEIYKNTGINMEDAVRIEQPRVKKLADFTEGLKFLFEDTDYEADLLVWKKSDAHTASNRINIIIEVLNGIPEENWNEQHLEETIKVLIKKDDLGNGDTLWPMRTALAGQKNSPGPFEIAHVLGKEKTLARLATAQQKIMTL